MITIGIDPHKASLTAVALDPTGHHVATRRVTVNAGAYKTLMNWAIRWPQRRFAVEGATGLGRGIAQLLAAHGEDVVDVPATLSARARLLDTGGTRKKRPSRRRQRRPRRHASPTPTSRARPDPATVMRFRRRTL